MLIEQRSCRQCSLFVDLILRFNKAIVALFFIGKLDAYLVSYLLKERLLLMETPRYFDSDFVASFLLWI